MERNIFQCQHLFYWSKQSRFLFRFCWENCWNQLSKSFLNFLWPFLYCLKYSLKPGSSFCMRMMSSVYFSMFQYNSVCFSINGVSSMHIFHPTQERFYSKYLWRSLFWNAIKRSAKFVVYLDQQFFRVHYLTKLKYVRVDSLDTGILSPWRSFFIKVRTKNASQLQYVKVHLRSLQLVKYYLSMAWLLSNSIYSKCLYFLSTISRGLAIKISQYRLTNILGSDSVDLEVTVWAMSL